MGDVSDLSLMQSWMATLVRRRRGLPGDEAAAAEARRHIAGNDRLSPAEQLEIYREQFWLRHTDSLVEDFPGLAGILVQDDWDHLVFGYLERCPPTSFTLRDLGARLPDFVAEQAWLPHPELCLDMARLEWIYVELFDAPDCPPLDLGKLTSLSDDDWRSARVVMSPALALLATRFAVADLRRTIKTSDERVPIPEPSPCKLVLYRGANRRLFDRSVSDGAFTLLTLLGRGEALVAACEEAMEHHPGEHLDDKLMGWFAEWGKLGWISDVER
jgi:hypothetical protein